MAKASRDLRPEIDRTLHLESWNSQLILFETKNFKYTFDKATTNKSAGYQHRNNVCVHRYI